MRRRIVAGLIATGVVARLAVAILHPPQAGGAPLSDPDQYVALGRTLAETGTLAEEGRPTAHREPFYPVVLSAAFRIFGVRYASVLAVNTALGAASLGLLYLLGADLYGAPVGLIALAVGAFYPAFLYYNALALRETAVAFCGLWTLWLLARASRRRRPVDFALAGAAAAVGAMAKTTMLPFGFLLAPAAAVAILRARRAPPWRPVAAYVAAFVLLYSAWPIRNYLSMHAWILGATEGGGNNLYLYQVIPQEVGGTPKQWEIIKNDPVCRAAMKMTPVERDRYFLKAGLALIRKDPRHYVGLVLWRFFRDFWRIMPRVRAYDYSTRLVRLTALATDGWIIPLGFIGMLLARLEVPEAAWLYLFVFAEAFIYSLIFTIIRYRFAVMPVLILFAAVTLDRLRRALGLGGA